MSATRPIASRSTITISFAERRNWNDRAPHAGGPRPDEKPPLVRPAGHRDLDRLRPVRRRDHRPGDPDSRAEEGALWGTGDRDRRSSVLRGPEGPRLTGGVAKGRRLFGVPGQDVRPALGRMRISVFEILKPRLEGAAVVD